MIQNNTTSLKQFKVATNDKEKQLSPTSPIIRIEIEDSDESMWFMNSV